MKFSFRKGTTLFGGVPFRAQWLFAMAEHRCALLDDGARQPYTGERIKRKVVTFNETAGCCGAALIG